MKNFSGAQALGYMCKHFLPKSATSSRERTGFSIE
jgi:hypothetical protein